MSTHPDIRSLISNNLSIPTIPEIVQRVTTLIEDPEAGTREIGELISQDAPLAAKVLRIANSAYYGLGGQCVSTSHASTVLGVRVLRNIVTQVAVISQYDHLEGEKEFDMPAMWRHSTLTAHLCAFMAKRAKHTTELTPEEFYVCGLLHDVGKVVLLDGLGSEYLRVLRGAREANKPLHLFEKTELGFNHTDVGAVVAARWGLPETVANGIQFHHGPREEVASNPVVALIANANLLVHRVGEGDEAAARAALDEETSRFLGLSEQGVAEIVQFAADNLATTV